MKCVDITLKWTGYYFFLQDISIYKLYIINPECISRRSDKRTTQTRRKLKNHMSRSLVAAAQPFSFIITLLPLLLRA